MSNYEQFERDLHDALAHLYDPAFQPSELLCAVLHCDPLQKPASAQAAVLRAIADLRPSEDVPLSARSRRIHQLLCARYARQLTQEEAADLLGITPRHLRREQRLAVAALARSLWSQRPALATSQEAGDESAGTSDIPIESLEWREQVRQELEALQKSAPDTTSGVREAVVSALELARTLASRRGVALHMGPVRGDLAVALHSSALRQILITCITELARHMEGGRIDISAGREDDRVEIVMTGTPSVSTVPPHDYLMQELLARQGGTIRSETAGSSTTFRITVPSTRPVRVLVVDDNADLVHFYERYTRGTRYQIVPTADGQRNLEAIEALAPDIIVLDLMLPDADGWELLAHLHESSTSRSIPLVVCSVVREEELSLALGATLYVPKPVRRQQFLEALDQALSQVAARAPKGPESSATTC